MADRIIFEMRCQRALRCDLQNNATHSVHIHILFFLTCLKAKCQTQGYLAGFILIVSW